MEDLSSGLPKQLVVQAIKVAEDLLLVGRAGHFVTCPESGSVLRFDTCVAAKAYIYTHGGAEIAMDEQVHSYLLEKIDDLVFMV